MRQAPAPQSGFTLIEAMVALAILGIASVGIIRAAEAHVDTLHRLEQRAAAQWAAENRLAELRLGTGAEPSSDSEVVMMGFRWRIRTALTSSADPDMRLATVTVAPAGTSDPLVTLRGFVDRGTTTR